ncbi:hypothetical protein RD792_007147 [Penstemon davidsonii]|uniref:Uncharacterized protein n=1 Tax=Penstemon davidsonii TaxID=160366 RepID=A0ABR0D5L0_9LAMI|nr:hypothetical protein RD792_007147 [Penstemon davidsonii]
MFSLSCFRTKLNCTLNSLYNLICFLFLWFIRYQKLQQGEKDDQSPLQSASSKYVILDEMDEEEDKP